MKKNTRRDFLKSVGAGLCFAAVGCVPDSSKGFSQKPNIILCMADDQGWGDMGYQGHPVLKTPNFDAMAAASLRFDHFYAAAPVCSPTRGSVMTGRHPNRFGCFRWGYPLRPQEITIAEALKKGGYVTGHFGKWHLGSVYKGSEVNPGSSGFDEWLSAPNFFDNNPILSREGTAVQTRGESSMVTVDAALEFIGRRSKGSQPFLAVVWFGSPHVPHKSAEEFRQVYADQGKEKSEFYGEIAGMDAAFGKLRQGLRTLGISDNTILWYCSDNGGLRGLGVTGGRGHKGQIYEGGLRVPALLEWPERIPSPLVSNIPACTSDIYPTLLEIAGVKMANQPLLDGISLVPVIEQEMTIRPKPIGFWRYHPTGGIQRHSDEWMAELLAAQKAGKEVNVVEQLLAANKMGKEVNDVDIERFCSKAAGEITRQYPEDSFPGHAAWLDWPLKLHRIQDKAGDVKLELYNLAEDPAEQRNLAAKNAIRTAAMKSELEAWLTSVIGSLNGKDYR